MEGYEGGAHEETDLDYLEGVCERAKERRKGFFGQYRTPKAEAAEMMLVAHVPALIRELQKLRETKKRKRGSFKASKRKEELR